MKSPTSAPKPSPSLPPPPPPNFSSDCSQVICTPNCLQWCTASGDYFLQPPPAFFSDSPDSSSRVSPLLIALICVLATAFLLLFYYAFGSKLCKRRRSGRSQNDVVDEEQQLQARLDALVLQDRLGPSIQIEASAANSNGGLDEGFIKSITVFKYKRGDGLVESTDCAVCLTEFNEEESLRLMPNCQHAFHPPCIDTWLRSQSNCPICRSPMIGHPPPQPPPPPPPAPTAVVSRMRVHRGGDVVVVVDAGRDQMNVRGEIVSEGRRWPTAEEEVGEKEKGRGMIMME